MFKKKRIWLDQRNFGKQPFSEIIARHRENVFLWHTKKKVSWWSSWKHGLSLPSFDFENKFSFFTPKQGVFAHSKMRMKQVHVWRCCQNVSDASVAVTQHQTACLEVCRLTIFASHWKKNASSSSKDRGFRWDLRAWSVPNQKLNTPNVDACAVK